MNLIGHLTQLGQRIGKTNEIIQGNKLLRKNLQNEVMKTSQELTKEIQRNKVEVRQQEQIEQKN